MFSLNMFNAQWSHVSVLVTTNTLQCDVAHVGRLHQARSRVVPVVPQWYHCGGLTVVAWCRTV